MTRAWNRSSRCRRFSRVAPVGAQPVRKCQGPSNSTAHVPVLLLPSPGRCRARSCRWSILTLGSGPRPSPTDSRRRVSLTCDKAPAPSCNIQRTDGPGTAGQDRPTQPCPGKTGAAPPSATDSATMADAPDGSINERITDLCYDKMQLYMPGTWP
jgi:hypothetical protein